VRLVFATAMVAALATVTGSTHPPHAAVPEPPADPGTVVLQVKEWRSLVGPSEWAAIPEVTILGGGRMVIPAGQAGALLRASESRLDAERYRQVYRLAHHAGLAEDAYLSPPLVATDGSLLVITLRSGPRTYTTKVVTPQTGESGPRGRVVRFRQVLDALVASARTEPYRPAAHVAFATGGFGTTEGRAAARPWPGGDLTSGVRVAQGLCTPLASVPAGVTGAAQWTSGGHGVWVTIRPLLPHERTCTDLEEGP
jgi:hypothetical protein